MRHLKFVGLAVVAALALTALAATSAFATAPEFGRCLAKTGGKFSDAGCTKPVSTGGKFEWTPGPGPKPKFHSKIKETTSATLETTGGTKITCKQEEGPGEFKNAKEVAKVEPTFRECLGFGQPCSSTGAASGEIKTSPLGGVVGVEKLGTTQATNKLAVELHSESGNIAEFACAGVPVVVKGSVLHPVSTNKMLITATEKFAATKGEQKPDKFVGGPADEHILESNNNGGPFEEAGQTITAINTGEEKMEASSVN
jgi:hypothetical protein